MATLVARERVLSNAETVPEIMDTSRVYIYIYT
jgi:hypothetical protein